MLGLALYEKDNRMFVLEVSYEFADSKFVGFRKRDDIYNGNLYEIKPRDGGYSIIRIDLGMKSRENAPIGKKYTQLPGGGATYKQTRQFTNPSQMVLDKTVKGVLDRFFGIQEMRNIIKKMINEVFLKQEESNVSFTAASVENKSDIDKINKVFESLKKKV
jgi:hypothetical protein